MLGVSPLDVLFRVQTDLACFKRQTKMVPVKTVNSPGHDRMESHSSASSSIHKKSGTGNASVMEKAVVAHTQQNARTAEIHAKVVEKQAEANSATTNLLDKLSAAALVGSKDAELESKDEEIKRQQKQL